MWNNYNQQRIPFNNNNNYSYNNNSNNMPYPQPSSFASYQQPNTVQSQSQNNVIWVRGKENARSMQLQPNSTLIMLDNQANKFYIKTTDDIGLGRLRIFNYSEQDDSQMHNQNTLNSVDMSNYVTKQELQSIIATLKGVKDNEQSISTTKPTKQPVIIKK